MADTTRSYDELLERLTPYNNHVLTQTIRDLIASLQAGAEQALTTGAGTGITTATGAIYESSVHKIGDIYETKIILDLTGTTSADTDLDVIGLASTALPCHLGQFLTAESGTPIAGAITCLEAPSSLTDIDFYAAALGTYVTGNLITDDASEVALVTAGGAWTNGAVKGMTGLPADGEYLYAVNGAADTPDPFTAGKFLIQIFGQ